MNITETDTRTLHALRERHAVRIAHAVVNGNEPSELVKSCFREVDDELARRARRGLER